MTRVRPLLVAIAALSAVAGVVGTSARAEDAPKHIRPLDPKEKQEIAGILRRYLDLSSDKTFEGRTQMLERLAKLNESGEDLLADVDALQSVIYAARPFAELPIGKRNLPKDLSKDDLKRIDLDDSDPNFVSISWPDHLRMSVSLPKQYSFDPKKTTEHAPWPMIVTLHELEDFQDTRAPKRFPGAEVIKRRWDPRGPMKVVTDEWVIAAPVAIRAKFIADDGYVDTSTLPLHQAWRRYHVDYDRFVIDGGSEALAFAATQSIYYAGVIVRGDKADVNPVLVRNFANLAVYVVGTEASAALKSLKAGGFPMEHVKVGGADGLAEWLKGVKRVVPKTFSWTVGAGSLSRMTQAQWITIVSYDEGQATIDAEIVDTKEDPNTVRLKTKLVRLVDVFLSDRLIDLNRPVRFVVNGKPLAKARAIVGGRDEKDIKLPAKLDRSFDQTFDNSDISMRKTQYFGWLYPTEVAFKITTDDVPPVPATAEVKTDLPAPPDPMTPAEEMARQYYAKASAAEKEGNVDVAKKLYTKALEQGETTIKAIVEERLKALAGTPKIVR